MDLNRYCPDFSCLKETLAGRYAGRIPRAEIDIAAEIKEAFLGHRIETAEDEVRFWAGAGYDYVLYPVEIDFVRGGFSGERVSPTAGAVIETLDQAKQFRWPDAADFDMSGIDRLAESLVDGMKIIPRVGGLFYFPSVLLGFENLCIAIMSDPEFAKYVFQSVGNIVTGLVGRLCSHAGVGAIWLSSDIAFGTSLMVGPDALREYVIPWIKTVCDIAHGTDRPVIFHSDGNLTEIIPDLIDAGIDALHPIEPQAMDIRVLRKQYCDQLCLVGNVDVDLLISGTPKQVADEVKSLCEFFDGQGGYVLSSGNSIPADVPLENFKVLIGYDT